MACSDAHAEESVAVNLGDLVVMPIAKSRVLLRPDLGVGLVVDDGIVRDRIGIMWSDGDGAIDYEPVAWLKVVNESRRLSTTLGS